VGAVPGYGCDMDKKVLVALDEGEPSHRAADFVNRFFSGADVEVLAINVARAPTPFFPPTVGYGVMYPWGYEVPLAGEPEERTQVLEARQHVAASLASETGLGDAEPIGGVGDPAEAIRQAADEHDVDLIVVGATDRGVLDRLFNPSVSHELTHHPTRPVLVVP
jgi:nucleotide-binding universal stress UspA family protein